MYLLPDNILKIAKSLELKKLIEAKKLSDKNDYGKKHDILKKLLEEHPGQFSVDSSLNNKYVGLTHKPSGFKIHAPRTLIPVGIEHKYNVKKAAKKERVRVIIPYKGKFLLESYPNRWPFF